MSKQQSQKPTRAAAPLAKHLAFAVIGAAILAETVAGTALIASSETTASLLTAEPLYRAHFAMVAAYYSVADFADQLFASFDLTALRHSAAAFASDRLSAILPVAVQLDNNQLSVILIGR